MFATKLKGFLDAYYNTSKLVGHVKVGLLVFFVLTLQTDKVTSDFS